MEKSCGRCAAPVSQSRCPVCGYDCSREDGQAALVAGTVLDDRYVLGRTIGSGGFGITYLAYDTELDRTVAVKEYFPKGMAVRGGDDRLVEPLASLQRERLFCVEWKNFTTRRSFWRSLRTLRR